MGVVSPQSSSALVSLKAVPLAASPASLDAGSAALSSIWTSKSKPSDLPSAAAAYLRHGLTARSASGVLGNANFPAGLEAFGGSHKEAESSMVNNNLREPSEPVCPRAGPQDPLYSLSEQQLRSAICIPPTFRYGAAGAPRPVILVPGTGNTGYETFVGNYIPLLLQSGTNSTEAAVGDPVWLNIPGNMLNDVQINAEYVAYAINYIRGILEVPRDDLAIIAWSQGNIAAQWAFKYWPSTRKHVTDHVAFSPDYHGTILATLVSLPDTVVPGPSGPLPLPPAVLQQQYHAKFIQTLRSNGGDSAYVPTTTVYSGFLDEIVEPQQDVKASAFLQDVRNVGVSNNEIQTVCKKPLLLYTHEGVLYSALGWALAVDALRNEGPGRVERIAGQLEEVCGRRYLAEGLGLNNFLLTEEAILVAAVNLLTYPAPVTKEPGSKQYASASA